MKTKLIILSILAVINVSLITAQIKEVNFLNNKVRFEVFRQSTNVYDTSNKSPAAIYLKTNLPNNLKTEFSKFSKSLIISLLYDSQTDWVTNLLLYEIYKRNAFMYINVIKNRKNWLPIKKNDIKYWKKILKS